ncbi:MAG: ATP-binding protein [Caldilineaceae bacterium]|nr:HAMP domain-containing protein [Caldilineaceae bacterium]
MLTFQSLRWRIALAYAALVVVIMAGLTVYLTRQVQDVALDDLRQMLLADARLLAGNRQLRSSLADGQWRPGDPELAQLAAEWGDLLQARVTVIAADGVVLAESFEDPLRMENHADRPEIVSALASGAGESTRFSRTMNREMLYLAAAIPALDSANTAPLGVLRLALPMSAVVEGVAPLQTTVVIGGVLAALFTTLLSFFVAERIARPIRQVTHAATQMSQGQWSAPLIPARQDEVGRLISAFNRMAERIQIQVGFLQHEQERLSSVLENMADGVIILDVGGNVQLINPSAARLLHVEEKRAWNLSFVQLARDHRLVAVWQRSQQSRQTEESILDVDRRVIRIVSTPFGDAQQRGYNVILQDLTQVRRLETVRRDFISNISHELRTPLASLRALVETLRDGALDDPPAAQRFLDRIETEVDALAQMVQELLELSRIESGRVPLRLKPTPLSDIILRPVERLLPQAERAHIELIIDLQGGVPPVMADAERVQQVITNLVHNAIKHTPAGGAITVRSSMQPDLFPDFAVISVIDTGEGISRDDLPRIFERFYKVDRARAASGTGLGLAIAKHIVQAHQGDIWAESIEGRGSTFSFRLPTVNNNPQSLTDR